MKKFLQILLWLVQGVIVGVGAILPGVSGGTLCYAFGIYSQLLEVLTSPIKGIKKNWFMLIFVGLGVGAGFIGFAGITARQSGLIVRCTSLCAQIVAAKQRSHLSRWRARITIAANVLQSAKRPKKRLKLNNKSNIIAYSVRFGRCFSICRQMQYCFFEIGVL